MSGFDPYLEWFGIPPGPRPPSPEAILGLQPGASDPQVIEDAAQKRMKRLEEFVLGPQHDIVVRLQREVTQAIVLLTSPGRPGESNRDGPFDPYSHFLGIPPGPRPPSPEAILGLQPGETDERKILDAAAKRKERLEQFLVGSHSELAAKITVEVREAAHALWKRAAAQRQRRRAASPGPASTTAPRRWLTLGALGMAQLMGTAALWIVGLLLVHQGESRRIASRAPAFQVFPVDAPNARPVPQALPLNEESRAAQAKNGQPTPSDPETEAGTAPSRSRGSPAFAGRKKTASSMALPEPKEIADEDLPTDTGPPSHSNPPPGKPGLRGGTRLPEGSDRAGSPRAPEADSGRTKSDTSDAIDLGGGKTVRLRDFAVSEDALTAAESASKPPWGLTVQPNSDFDEADLFDEAYLQVDSNRRLLGLAVAYREDQLKLVAAYSDGKRQGVAILWTAEGQLWYCARYARGHHEGYCCLFRAGEPIAVCEHASDQLITLHLIAERKARKSLNRSEHVLGDEEAKQVQLEIASAESELEAIERAFKGIASGIQQQAKPKIQQQAKPKIQEQTKPKNQQAAAKASVARRRNTIDRMNQRARSQKAALENLLRAKGF